MSSAIADATITSESGTHQVSLNGVFTDADGNTVTDEFEVTASPAS